MAESAVSLLSKANAIHRNARENNRSLTNKEASRISSLMEERENVLEKERNNRKGWR